MTYPEIPDTIGQAVIAENPTNFGKTERENEVPASIASAWRAVNAAKKKSADIKDFEKSTLKALHKGIAVTAVLEESTRKPAILKARMRFSEERSDELRRIVSNTLIRRSRWARTDTSR